MVPLCSATVAHAGIKRSGGGDPFGLASPFAKALEDKSEAALHGLWSFFGEMSAQVWEVLFG